MKNYNRPLTKQEILNLPDWTDVHFIHYNEEGEKYSEKKFSIRIGTGDESEIIFTNSEFEPMEFLDGAELQDTKFQWHGRRYFEIEIFLDDVEGAELLLMPAKDRRRVAELIGAADNFKEVGGAGDSYGCIFQYFSFEIEASKEEEALAVIAASSAVKRYGHQSSVCSPYDCTGEAFGSRFKLLDCEFMDGKWFILFKHTYSIDI